MTKIHVTKDFDEYMLADRTPVRVVCVDALGGLPVIAVDHEGGIYRSQLDGTRSSGYSPIVKQKRKPREWYLATSSDGTPLTYHILHKKVEADSYTHGPVIKVREVLGDECN